MFFSVPSAVKICKSVPGYLIYFLIFFIPNHHIPVLYADFNLRWLRLTPFFIPNRMLFRDLPPAKIHAILKFIVAVYYFVGK